VFPPTLLWVFWMAMTRIRLLRANEELPVAAVTAVFLVAFRDSRMLAIRNERGWDLPGGHLEPNEDLITALRREVREEAGAVFTDSFPYALLSIGRPQSMLVYVTSVYEMIAEWQPYEDCLERANSSPNGLSRGITVIGSTCARSSLRPRMRSALVVMGAVVGDRSGVSTQTC
jgi:ADP-ribose pyrophosphatase YjhB (NUDIX family)